jgi:hypothetical protein
MSLLTTTVYTAPVWSIFSFDYLSGIASAPIVLPDYFNKHTLWIGHWLYPAGLIDTPAISSGLNGLLVDFLNPSNNTDYPVSFFRPPSSSNAAGNLVAAGLAACGLVTNLSQRAVYIFGNGGTSGNADVLGVWADDSTLTIPLGNMSSSANFVDHYSPNAKVICAMGGTNTAPDSISVSNMAICSPIDVCFTANKIAVNCPSIIGIMTTGGGVYWAYGFGLIKSEQV